jgi:hypothetical protein
LYGNQMKTGAGLDIQNAQFQEGRKDAYEKALQTQADYQMQQFNYNQVGKYGEKYNYLTSLMQGYNADKQAAMKNVIAGAGAIANIGGSLISAGAKG